MNDVLEKICQITALKDLKLSDNALSGEVTPNIEQLRNLEVLELQGNKLSSLPEEIKALVNLKVLNVSMNRLKSLPTASLSALPLVELYATKNSLHGTLFGPAVLGMIRLQMLDVSVNQLDALSSDLAMPDLPELRTLNIAFNNVKALPDVSPCPKLSAIFAEDNGISSLPDGFIELQHLRMADFTGNDMSRLDEKISIMDCLENFKVQANPLRERKFLTMSTDELKRDLKARLAPPAHADGSDIMLPNY
jgi:Leucine-rich repeat (LRR) protein